MSKKLTKYNLPYLESPDLEISRNVCSFIIQCIDKKKYSLSFFEQKKNLPYLKGLFTQQRPAFINFIQLLL